MKKIGTLIRVAKRRVDEERRKVAELEALAAEIGGRMAALSREVEAEQASAARSYDAIRAYGSYAAYAIERRARLASSRQALEAEIASARDDLAAAFEELKRYEITAERAAKVALRAAERRERTRLDDVAVERYRRGAA